MKAGLHPFPAADHLYPLSVPTVKRRENLKLLIEAQMLGIVSFVRDERNANFPFLVLNAIPTVDGNVHHMNKESYLQRGDQMLLERVHGRLVDASQINEVN